MNVFCTYIFGPCVYWVIYLADGFFLFLMQTKKIRRQRESKIPFYKSSGGMLFLRPSWSYNKLLDRITFRILWNILSNIHDGALLQK